MSEPTHSPLELERLAEELRSIGPGWFLATGREGLLRAERGGTLKHEQAALSPRGLLEAVRQREQHLIAAGEAAVPIRTGRLSK